MYRSKIELDEYVEYLRSKLSLMEFKTEAYTFARLYFDVGDFASCQKYVEQYLTCKDNNAAAYKLLGQALQKLGEKDRAMEHFKTSLGIDPTQTSTVLDICELIADDNLAIEPGHAKHWCEKADATFPNHPVTLRLRERLVTLSNSDPEALVKLLLTELAVRPKDALLHARLLKHYLNINKHMEAFEHSCNIEFSDDNFINSYAWYEVLEELLKHNLDNVNNWQYQLLLLTVRERICVLSLTETPSGSSNTLVESNELLHAYDQALDSVAKAGAPSGYAEFHASLLQHHRGQFAFYAATFLLKKAKKNQISWRDVNKIAALLMLIAWQTVPLDSNVNWLKHAPEKLLCAVKRWYIEGAYRCSQSGHYLISNFQDKNQNLLDQISQCCSRTDWKNKLYEKIFSNRNHLAKIKSSHFVSKSFNAPVSSLPRKNEVEAYDGDAQKQYGNSLHHFVWTMLSYKNYAHFKFTLFEMLSPTETSCGPETLNKLDIHAFLYCAALTARQQKANEVSYVSPDKPNTLPAIITDLLCPLSQMKWWDCAYKFSQNVLGTELTDIQVTLSCGIEVVRCIDNHGLDPELLCLLGRIFIERGKITTSVEEETFLEVRAGLYYGSAIPLLEKLKSKIMVKVSDNRLFGYTHKELGNRELNTLLEESKLYVAINHMNDCEYDKSIKVLSNVKSAHAYYQLAQIYKKVAQEEFNSTIDGSKSRNAALLSKSKSYAYKALDMLKDTEANKDSSLYIDTQEIIEGLEVQLNKIDPDVSVNLNDVDGKYSSDENDPYKSEPMRANNNMFRNISSTPKAPSNPNMTNYRTAIDSNILESTRIDQQHLERIENEMKNLQNRDKISVFMAQTREWFDESRKLDNQIISTLNSNLQSTTDELKLLKISVDQVKDQIDECRNKCKDVAEQKNQIHELKKELNSLKKTISEQAIDESDLYNYDDEYKTNESAPNYAAAPFPPQMLPQFNQRPLFPVPQKPYQLYNQGLYNLNNQYSPLAQSSSVPHLIPPTEPAAHSVPAVATVLAMPAVPVVPTLPSMPSVPTPALPTSVAVSKATTYTESKAVSRAPPLNVGITLSDPLPTCVSTSAPVLSVTLPPKQIKDTQHNYQIAMPTSLNTSLNKSRTLSEKSNTLVDNYDSCPDFKPIVPLPAEVKVTTGEENEVAIFTARAKLFRFVDKQWKEKGIGEMKLLKHKVTNKVRVLMRREKVHKICANHIITPEMNIQPMKNETKAYFWVANDFAEENLVLENFSVRFKTADIAKNFFEAFDKARLESKNKEPNTASNKSMSESEQFIPNETSTLVKETGLPSFTQNKTFNSTRVGWITFSSTPIFEPVENQTKPNELNTATESKTNVFGGITFKSDAPTPLNNLLNTVPAISSVASTITEDMNNSKLNTSDTVEEFEPIVEFKPVVPMPALVEQKTGEDDEQIIFEHRAKLLRFDSNTKEWKERGLGNIKLLVHSGNDQKMRLLMRRDQIMKVCCNHSITKDLSFQKMPTIDKAVTWCAKDFSEGELVTETFCLRFKTVKICDDFMEAIKSAQCKLKDDTKAAEKEKNAAIQTSESGFGDQFKAKPGSWQCKSCYTNNLENIANCACCEQPKPRSKAVNVSKIIPFISSSWGDKFKPKPGSWECQSRFVRNEATLDKCTACNTAKDPSAAKSGTNVVKENTVKFSFGIPSQTSASILNQAKTESNEKSTLFPGIGFGDIFKLKEGSWECKQCFVRNEGNSENCVACNNSTKDANAPKNKPNVFDTSAKFRFGIPPTPTNDEKPKTEPALILDRSGSHKFSFGIPPATKGASDPKPTGVIFAAPKIVSETEALNFSLDKTEEPVKAPAKPALLLTPLTKTNSFAGKESGAFGFEFKQSTSNISPAKSPNKTCGGESDAEEYVKEEDCHAHFNPVIPMPEKVEVVTEEENETALYSHRARLYRFVSGGWKERGTGVVKILENNDTGKYRVVMRREQVLNPCLNHVLTPEITYKPKDEKSWLFVASDCSEGELSLQNFCIRFQNKDIALQFKQTVDNALKGKPVISVAHKTTKTELNEKDDDVLFISQIQASAEDKLKAKELMLPENFYTYKTKDPCQGCRGCKQEDDVKPETSSSQTIKAISSVPSLLSSLASIAASMPTKPTFPTFQSPNTSIHGTPENMEDTFDTSMFRTPLGSIGSNTKSSTLGSNNNDTIGIENKSVNPVGIYGFGEQNPIFSTPTSLANLFGAGNFKPTVNGKSSIIAPPKLSTFNTSSDNQSPDPKSIFAEAATKPTFSGLRVSGQSSIFGNSSTSTKSIMPSTDKRKDDSRSVVKVLFGGNDPKPLSIHSETAQGSLFRPGGSLGNQPASGSFLFGPASAPQSNAIKSIFSNSTIPNQSSISSMTPNNDDKKLEVSAFLVSSDNIPQTQESIEKKTPEIKESLFKYDITLSLAAMSISGPGFAVQKKPEFQWEGMGQQLFSEGHNASKDSQIESGAGDVASGADEEYDPHYESIVPLPENIVVTTGEEDEKKVFGERCKLYRYNEITGEWEERGVGKMKILYHPHRNTYRLLLRREQVHKAVLNMLLFMDLELLPMKNSDRGWTWVGRNFAEFPAGEQETLAVRFKSVELAHSFRKQVVHCITKMQAAAAQAIREEQEAKVKAFDAVAPLRLPKHLANSARADGLMSAAAAQAQASASQEKPTGDSKSEAMPDSKQVTYQEPKGYQNEDEDCDDDGYYQRDYEAYYNEEEKNTYYSCIAEAVVKQGDEEISCLQAHIQVLFDQDIYLPKILVTDACTGEILANTFIHTDTEFQMNGDSCTWSGREYTTNEVIEKTVTVNFYYSYTALKFFDRCETSKAATIYCSTDPES